MKTQLKKPKSAQPKRRQSFITWAVLTAMAAILITFLSFVPRAIAPYFSDSAERGESIVLSRSEATSSSLLVRLIAQSKVLKFDMLFKAIR